MAFNPEKCLKFKALADNCTISIPISKVDSSHYQFSKDGTTWQNDSITLNANETCYVKGTNYPSKANSNSIFSFSKQAEIISGNIMSLVDDGAGEVIEITQTYGFARLFYLIVNLVSLYEGMLPATTLASKCYYGMFSGCKGLTSLPEKLLPATTLADQCYFEMFKDCTGLTSLPEKLLPATILTINCYDAMFSGCTGLTSLPEKLLPATTLANNCYYNMFYMCTGLTSLPKDLLPAATLAKGCYDYMFNRCSNLNEITVLFTSWKIDDQECTNYWLYGVADEGTFYCPEELPDIRGVNNIPTNWQKLPIPVEQKQKGSMTFFGRVVTSVG